VTPHVLVVDDDPTVLDHACWCLTAGGYAVTTARNGEEALPLLSRALPDVLLTDVSMPVMDGFELVERMRHEIGPACAHAPRVIYLSSADDRASLKRAMRIGASDFLSKPISRADLLAAVRAQLAHTRPAARVTTDNKFSVVEQAGYRIISTLAQNDSSTVYHARHCTSGRDAALKVLRLAHSDAVDDPASTKLARFFNEYATLATMSHTNVARVYEHGVADECLFIAMEYFDGGDLSRIVGAGLGAHRARNIALQITDALTHIHARDVIHRDLKPSNVMLRQNGEVAIVDFGIAKSLTMQLHHTRHRETVGTPYYISPEAIRGSGVDARTDLYSLGLLLFEMLCGRRPYEADSIDELLAQHLHADVPALPAGLAAFSAVLERLLAKRPADRFASARDAAAALLAIPV
jgi:serine/threonine protein kinase